MMSDIDILVLEGLGYFEDHLSNDPNFVVHFSSKDSKIAIQTSMSKNEVDSYISKNIWGCGFWDCYSWIKTTKMKNGKNNHVYNFDSSYLRNEY